MAKILKYGEGNLTSTYLNNYIVNKCPSLGEIRSNLKSDFEITSVTPGNAVSSQLITGISFGRVTHEFCKVYFNSTVYTIGNQWKLTIYNGSLTEGYICYLPPKSEGSEWSDGCEYTHSVPTGDPNGFDGAGLNIDDYYDYVTVELYANPDTELVDYIDLDSSNVIVNGERSARFDNTYTAKVRSAELYAGGEIEINIVSL